MADKELNVKISADLSQFNKAMATMQSQIKAVQNKLKSAFSGNESVKVDVDADITKVKQKIAGLDGQRITLDADFTNSMSELQNALASIGDTGGFGDIFNSLASISTLGTSKELGRIDVAFSTLEATMADAQAKLDDINEQFEAMAGAIPADELEDFERKYRPVVNRLNEVINKCKAAKQAKEDLGDSSEKAAKGATTLSGVLKQLKANLNPKNLMGGLSEELGSFAKKIPMFGTLTKGMSNSMVGAFTLAAGAAVALGIAIYKVGKALMDNLMSTIAWANEMQGFSQRLGITTDEVQRLQYTLMMSNIELDDYAQLVEQISGATRDMLDPSSNMSKNLKAIGVSAMDANGKLKTSEQIIDDVAVAMEKLNPQDAQRMATLIFGEGDAKTFLKYMNDIAAKKAEASKIPVISESEMQRLQDLGNNFKRIGAIWDWIKKKMAVAFEPLFSLITEGLLKGLQMLKPAFDWIVDKALAIGDAFKKLAQNKSIQQLNMMLSGIGGVIMWVKGQFVAFTTFIDTLIYQLTDSFNSWFGGISSGLSNLGSFFSEFINILYIGWSTLWEGLSIFWMWTYDVVVGVIKVIADTFGWLVNLIIKLLTGDFAGAWAVTWQWLGDLWQSLKGMIGRPLAWAWDKIFDFLEQFGKANANIISSIGNVVANVVDGIMRVVNYAINGINQLLPLANGAIGIINQVLGTNFGTINPVNPITGAGDAVRNFANNFGSIMGGLRQANPFTSWVFEKTSIASTPKASTTGTTSLDYNTALGDIGKGASKAGSGLKDMNKGLGKVNDKLEETAQLFNVIYGEIFRMRKVFTMFTKIIRPSYSTYSYAGVDYALRNPVQGAGAIVNQYNIQATIREDADIKKLAVELNDLQKRESRKLGVAYGF